MSELDLTGKVNPIVEQAAGLEVAGADGYERAAGLLKAIKRLLAEIDDTFTEAVKAAHGAHRKVLAAKKRHAEPLEAAESQLKKGMLGFHAVAEQRARAESAKAQAQITEVRDGMALEEAAALEKAGRDDEARAVLERAALTGAPAGLTGEGPPKIPGISIRKTWKARIVDEALVPPEYLKIDVAKISKVAKALGRQAQIPGVEVYEGREIAVTLEAE